MTRPRVQRPIMFTLACAACSVLALSAALTWSAHAQTSAELTQQTSAVRTHNALPRYVLQTLQIWLGLFYIMF